MTPWWRRRLALVLIAVIGSMERTAVALYEVARRLAPREFVEAERLAALADELDEIRRTAPPLDYDERRPW